MPRTSILAPGPRGVDPCGLHDGDDDEGLPRSESSAMLPVESASFTVPHPRRITAIASGTIP